MWKLYQMIDVRDGFAQLDVVKPYMTFFCVPVIKRFVFLSFVTIHQISLFVLFEGWKRFLPR